MYNYKKFSNFLLLVTGLCMKYKKLKGFWFWGTIKFFRGFFFRKNMNFFRDFRFYVTIKLFSIFFIWFSQVTPFPTTGNGIGYLQVDMYLIVQPFFSSSDTFLRLQTRNLSYGKCSLFTVVIHFIKIIFIASTTHTISEKLFNSEKG